MPASLRRTFSLNKSTDCLIEMYCKRYGISASEANRLAWESAIRHDRNIMKDHLLARESELKKGLEEIQAELKTIEEGPQFDNDSVLDSYDQPQTRKTKVGMTDEQIFDSYRSDILKDTPSSKFTRKSIRALIEKRPDMKDRLTPEEIERLGM